MDGVGERWVITGAAGRIGVELRRALRDEGVPLRSTDARPIEPIDDGDEVAVLDLADLEGLEALLADARGVVHLGGLSDEADFHDLADVNVVGTYHVLEAARRAGVGRVVFASSNRVTGMYPTTTRVDVEMPPRADGLYGVSKIAGEALCRLYAEKLGLSTIALRIGSFEQQPSDARQVRTWLSPDDAIRAVTAAMRTPVHHATFYAVSSNRDGWWDLEAGRRVGFDPEDDAARWVVDGTVVEPQGGAFATSAYTLERMRR